MDEAKYHCKRLHCEGHEYKGDFCETWIKEYSHGNKKIVNLGPLMRCL